MTINGLRFRTNPLFCGHCPAYIRNSDHKGWCSWFDLNKHQFDKVPARCKRLFDKAYSLGDGDYVIVLGENN
jgi:hypothetical protein